LLVIHHPLLAVAKMEMEVDSIEMISVGTVLVVGHLPPVVFVMRKWSVMRLQGGMASFAIHHLLLVAALVQFGVCLSFAPPAWQQRRLLAHIYRRRGQPSFCVE